MKGNYDVARLKDLLGPVGKKLRLEDPAAAGTIWRRWAHIVGDEVARHAEPTSLKEGVLRVRTSSPVWATEITYLAADIKDRVNAAVGKPLVREVTVWTSPAPIRSPRGDAIHTPGGTHPVAKEPSPKDPETAFQRAFQAWSKRRQRGSR